MATQDDSAQTDPAGPAPEAPGVVSAIGKKRLIYVGIITLAVWAFAIQTGSKVLMIIVGVLTLLLIGIFLWAVRMIGKQKRMIGLMQGATGSVEARREALAKLEVGKDAKAPTTIFARAQLLASDDPKAALALLESVELKVFPATMQDDVSLLKVQIYLSVGRTQDARKCADSMNLENPARKEIRPLAASLVAEALARTGKPKEALALLDSIELPKKDREQIEMQAKVARVFARFAANQRAQAKRELEALAEVDLNQLGRFVAPQFRVHPELQKLARQVFQQHPGSRKHIKTQTKRA
ncbi:MAG: tetratricopeptide repeat protein [Deltaproteobacteria bacterium]|nr:tetratricopeptide repeat protein [Deltaproteobacteria bacterium]